jgi:hypothetical protein
LVVAFDRTGLVQAERPGSARTKATGEYTQARRRSINMDMYEHTEHHVSSSIARSSIESLILFALRIVSTSRMGKKEIIEGK